jgi:acyl-coenzyme A thioesterase PaaI-like protein
LPPLGDDEDAVTHMTSMSYLAPPEAGAKLRAPGEVLRRSLRLAFVTNTLLSGDRPLATASLTKFIFTTDAG